MLTGMPGASVATNGNSRAGPARTFVVRDVNACCAQTALDTAMPAAAASARNRIRIMILAPFRMGAALCERGALESNNALQAEPADNCDPRGAAWLSAPPAIIGWTGTPISALANHRAGMAVVPAR